MAFKLGDIVAVIKADASNFNKTVAQVKKEAGNLEKSMKKGADSVNLIGLAFKALVALKVGEYLQGASREASNFERAMVSLEIISERFGVSAEKAKEQANLLGRELRIGVGASAEALQNLLKSGLNLEQASDLIRRFTNEAMTGKSANISLATAVQNLSFAYATGNSALGNMSGISENFSDIMKQGEIILGSYNGRVNENIGLTQELVTQIQAYEQSLKAQGKRLDYNDEAQQKYVGMLKVTNLTLGSSARFTGTLIDTQAQLEQKLLDTQVAIGQLINPYINQFLLLLLEIIPTIKQVTDFIENNKAELVGLASALTVLVIPAFVAWLATLPPLIAGMWALAGAVLSATWPLLLIASIVGVVAYFIYRMWTENWWGIQEVMAQVIPWLTNAFNTLVQAVTGAINWIVDTWNYLANTFTSTQGSMSSAISGAFTSALDFIMSIWNGITSTVMSGVTAISNFFTSVGNSIATFFNTYVQPVLNTFAMFFNWVWYNMVFPILYLAHAIFLRIFFEISNLISSVFTFIKDQVIVPIFTFIYEWISSTLTNIYNNMVQAFTTYISIWLAIFNFIYNNIVLPIFNAISGAIKTALDFIVNKVVNPLLTSIRNTFNTVFNAVKSVVVTVFDFLVAFANAKMTDFYNNVITPIVNIYNEATRLIGDLGNWIMDSFNQLTANVVKWGADFYNALIEPWNKGKKFIEETAQKIYDLADKINPYHKESPSLVENVQAGIGDIISAYQRLNDLSFTPVVTSYQNLPASANSNITQNVTVYPQDAIDISTIADRLAYKYRSAL